MQSVALCLWSRAAGGGNSTSEVAALQPAVSAQQIPNDSSDLHRAALRFHRPSEILCHGDGPSSARLGQWTERFCVSTRVVVCWRGEKEEQEEQE